MGGKSRSAPPPVIVEPEPTPPPEPAPGPDLSGIQRNFQRQLEQQQRQFQEAQRRLEAERRQQEAERRRTTNYAQIDDLWGARGSAVESAIADVDRAIRAEQDQAALVGLDYTMTDEQRQQRVSNLFAEYWSEENENRLLGLANQFGDPTMSISARRAIESGARAYEPSFAVTRGTASDADLTTIADRQRAQQQGPARTAITGGTTTVNLLEEEEEAATNPLRTTALGI
jgi:hypothetical protein